MWIDHHNFQRTHQGIGGLVPADRYFGVASEVLETLKARVADNALELARHGVPRQPFYVVGQAGGKSFSLHAEGERVILTKEQGAREEVELVAPEVDGADEQVLPPPVTGSAAELGGPEQPGMESPQAPGASSLDEGLRRLAEMMGDEEDESDEPTGGAR